MNMRFMFALILCLALAPTALATDIAGDMAAGTWTTSPRYVTFGTYNAHSLIWRVLEVKENDLDFNGIKTAFLLLDDLLRDNDGNVEMMRFDRSNSNFPGSRVKEWLNDGASGFLAGLDAYQSDILNTTYGPDNASRKWHGGTISGTSKVFLLSVGEINNKSYFADNADRAVSYTTWWLRSPGFGGREIAAIVLITGEITRNGFYVDNMCAVRPALKIDISHSSVFASLPVSYGLTVKADDGNKPIKGAKVSLSPTPAARNAESYSNSVGAAHFSSVAPGTYNIAVFKPGYIDESRSITVPSIPVIHLTPDPTALPDKVEFGKYNENPIEWSVLDIVNGKALLFAGALFQEQFDTRERRSEWANSTLRAHLNSNAAGGFLQGSNFTAEETAAIDAAASATGDLVFLLSIDEVYKYLPDANMRYYDDKEWLTRTSNGAEDVVAIRPDGEYGGGFEAYTRRQPAWIRPAIWVDLRLLRDNIDPKRQ